MTLEEKALEHSMKINGLTKEDCYDLKGELFQFIKSEMNIYLAGAKEVKADCDFALEGKDVEIKELKAQIEKMKCCGNCKHCKYNEGWESNEVCDKHQQIVNVSIVACTDWEYDGINRYMGTKE